MAKRNNKRGFDREMSFLDHLEELRWHLVRSVAAIVLLMFGFFVFVDELVKYVILGPMRDDFVTNVWLCKWRPAMCIGGIDVDLQALGPSEQFVKAIVVSIFAAIIIAFPYIIWEIWRFVRPALKSTERQLSVGFVFYVSFLFFTGVTFSYFVVTPFALGFLANFQITDGIENNWRIGQVIGLIVRLSLAGGLLFQLPILTYMLAKVGIITPKLMRKYRRHAIVVVLIIAGILTPSPDMFTQLMLGIPMLLLYELSIFIAARVHKKQKKEQAQREAELKTTLAKQEAEAPEDANAEVVEDDADADTSEDSDDSER